MNITVYLTSMALAAALTGLGQAVKLPVLTLGGVSYTNATLTKRTEAKALLDWDGGGKMVQISELPDDLKRQLGYDAAAAAAGLRRESNAAAAKHRSAMAQEREANAWRAANCRMLGNVVIEKRYLQPLSGQVVGLQADGVFLQLSMLMTNYARGPIIRTNEDSQADSGGIMLGPKYFYARGAPTGISSVPMGIAFVICQPGRLRLGQAAQFLVKRSGNATRTFRDHSGLFSLYIASTPFVAAP